MVKVKQPVDIDRRGRHYAINREGTVVTFVCPCGRSYKVDYSKGPVAKRMGPQGVAMMSRWWSKEAGGCISAPCPACRREKKAV